MSVSNGNGVSNVKRRILRTLLESERIVASGLNTSDSQGLLHELQVCTRNLNRIRSLLSPNNYQIIKNSLQQLITIITDTSNSSNSNASSFTFYAGVLQNSAPGRPALSITRDQLQLLFEQGFTAKKMAKELKCSISTVYKRCYEEGFKFRNRYAVLSDEELVDKIKILHDKYPNTGAVMMDGYLKSEGLVVKRQRIRKVLADIDPQGTARRWSRTIKRRMYKVATPNSLWHMDAHMKLSRWGFATHGCIDGYSRAILYVSCATSVTAETVINLFVPAVEKYGLPSRVRSDHGYCFIFV